MTIKYPDTAPLPLRRELDGMWGFAYRTQGIFPSYPPFVPDPFVLPMNSFWWADGGHHLKASGGALKPEPGKHDDPYLNMLAEHLNQIWRRGRA